MVKRWLCVILAVMLLLNCLSGCGGNGQKTPSAAEQERIREKAFSVLQEELALPETAAKELVAEQVEKYRDETVVRYSQIYEGVEVFGSSVVVASGEENLCIGTYYDLSCAFGADFEEQVREARNIPAWMTERQGSTGILRYRAETMKPVIYVLPDETAVVARQVDAIFETAEGSAEYTMVLSLDGRTLYTWQSYDAGFAEATVSGPNGETCKASKEDGYFYAYDREMNFYVYDRSVSDALSHVTNGGASISGALMYRTDSGEWTSGKAEKVFEAMSAFGDVARWYRDVLGYNGIDGKKGTAMVVLASGTGPSVAVNAHRYGYVTYLYTTEGGYTAADAPEILAHEYGHAIIKNISGTKGSGQTAALCEAICDVFGACYLKGWHLAAVMAGTGDDKNIAGTSIRTMDDYIYDTLDDYGDTLNNSADNGFYSFMYEIYENHASMGLLDDYITMSSDAYHYHENAYVVSYTLHRIWDKALNRNYEVLANLVMNSIRYLPKDADFSDFRMAFLYSARKIFDKDMVAYMSTFFDVAKIETVKPSQLVNVGTAKDSSVFHYAMLLGMSYGEISRMDWEQQMFYDSYDYPGQWFFNAEKGRGMVFLDFNGTAGDPDAYPCSVSVYDLAAGTAGLPVLANIRTGMTYEEIRAVLPEISALEDQPEMDRLYAHCIRADGLSLSLYFTNAMGEPVLESAVISSIR